MTMVTDMRHYLDEEGCLPEMPGPALNLALFQGAIVEWMTVRPISGVERTNVYCERRPKRVRCGGDIYARFKGKTITWSCPQCGDDGLIRGWLGSLWDRGPTSTLGLA